MGMPPFTGTIRFRLTVWYSSLLLIFGAAFVVALNLAARLDRPESQYDRSWTLVQTGPNELRVISPQAAVSLKQAQDELYDKNLENLRNWSLIAIVGLTLASGVGGYVLSGMMLRPVRDIQEAASAISVKNLKRRINHQGPDDELKALADTFDSMVDRLEHSFEQQREFVQDASHELRTPLTAIRTNIEVAEMDEMTVDEYRTLLDTIKTQTARLTRLSEDLLLLTTNEGTRPELEPVCLVDVGREVVSQLAPLAANRDVTLRVSGDTGLDALANGDLLYRCVFNLVDNAIKYAGNGVTVTIAAQRLGELAQLSVEDNGAGIPRAMLDHVFDRFYRVDKGRSRREGGTGLGLAIVRELVLAMNGTVTVESVEGLGSTFTIRLHAEAAEPDHRAPSRASAAAVTSAAKSG